MQPIKTAKIGTSNNAVHRLYQGVLCFENIAVLGCTYASVTFINYRKKSAAFHTKDFLTKINKKKYEQLFVHASHAEFRQN
jgi:hypothetical protein